MTLDTWYDARLIPADFDRVARPIGRAMGSLLLYDLLMGFWERRSNQALIEAIDPALPARRIIEVGVGTGHLLGTIAGHYPNAKVSGIDFSSCMLKATRKRLRQCDGPGYCTGRIRLFRTDLFAGGCLPTGADILVSSFFLDLLPGSRLDEGVARLLNLLGPSGRAYIACLSTDARRCPWFRLTQKLYACVYRSRWARQVSAALFNGYFTHSRPIDLVATLERCPGFHVTRTASSSINVLGAPILPVLIAEVARNDCP
jgi:SAM-dependent methyltransferase